MKMKDESIAAEELIRSEEKVRVWQEVDYFYSYF